MCPGPAQRSTVLCLASETQHGRRVTERTPKSSGFPFSAAYKQWGMTILQRSATSPRAQPVLPSHDLVRRSFSFLPGHIQPARRHLALGPCQTRSTVQTSLIGRAAKPADPPVRASAILHHKIRFQKSIVLRRRAYCLPLPAEVGGGRRVPNSEEKREGGGKSEGRRREEKKKIKKSEIIQDRERQRRAEHSPNAVSLYHTVRNGTR